MYVLHTRVIVEEIKKKGKSSKRDKADGQR